MKVRVKTMKRLAAIAASLMVAVSMLCLPAVAQGYKPSGNRGCRIKFDVPKVDSGAVVKDGLIGDGEYRRIELDTDPETTDLYLVYGTDSRGYDRAVAMLKTVEYYFSWDDVHGFNFAVRYKPERQVQQLDVEHGGRYPEDNFLNNCGVGISILDRNRSNSAPDFLYYSIAKKTDGSGEYLRGWWDQLGISGHYDPVPERDFIIEYEDDGYITCEWSIPFSEILKTDPVGAKIYLSLSAMAGDSPTADFSTLYGVSLGDRGFLVPQDDSSQHAVAVLIDGSSPDGEGDPPSPTPDPVPDPTPDSTPDTTPSRTPAADTESVADTEVKPNSTNGETVSHDSVTAPQTGDPSLLLSAAAATSAAGVLYARRRRRK